MSSLVEWRGAIGLVFSYSIFWSSNSNLFLVCVLSVTGLDKIEFLQSHENQEIYQKAFDLIERYFGVEEDDPSLVPQVDEQQRQFLFQQCEAPGEGFQLWQGEASSSDRGGVALGSSTWPVLLKGLYETGETIGCTFKSKYETILSVQMHCFFIDFLLFWLFVLL